MVKFQLFKLWQIVIISINYCSLIRCSRVIYLLSTGMPTFKPSIKGPAYAKLSRVCSSWFCSCIPCHCYLLTVMEVVINPFIRDVTSIHKLPLSRQSALCHCLCHQKTLVIHKTSKVCSCTLRISRVCLNP